MRGIRLLIVLGILVAGLCAAWPFRQDPPAAPQPPPAAISPNLLPRGRDVTLEAAPPGEASPAVDLAEYSPAPVRTASVTIERPDLSLLAPPPAMPAAFDPAEPVVPQSLPPRAAIRTYRLRDGDTLEWVAQRFLGAPSRADELFELNRDVLARADLLPVGVTIKIPQKEK